MTKQIIRFATAIMTTLLALVILWQFRIAFVYVLISLALAAALRPMIQRLAGKKFVVRAGWILLYLVVIGSIGFLIFLASETALKEIQRLAETLSVRDAWMLPKWLEGSSFELALVAQLPAPSKLYEAFTGDQGQLVLPALLGFVQGIGGLFSAGAVILLLSIYWSINQIHFERLWLSLLPSDKRKQARGIWRTIEPDLGAYIRSELIQSLVGGILLGLGYWLLGSPYPALLALIGAIACLIPVVGIPLAILSVLFVGLLTSVPLSLVTAVYTLIVLVSLGIWLKPKLFNRKWNNPILTVILLIALVDAFGLIGIILAPPLSVICQILWDRLVSHRAISGAAAQVSDLRERQARLVNTITAMEEPAPVLVTSSMQRLTDLLTKAESILPAIPQADPTGSFHLAEPITPGGDPTGSIKP